MSKSYTLPNVEVFVTSRVPEKSVALSNQVNPKPEPEAVSAAEDVEQFPDVKANYVPGGEGCNI